MRLERLWALSLYAAAANANFQGTSPFFAFTTSSSASFQRLVESPEIVSGFMFSSSVNAVARGCKSDAYILVSQRGVSSKDFSHKNATPHLARRLGAGADKDSSVTQHVVVPEVAGDVDTSGLRQKLQTNCKASSATLDFESGDIAFPEDNQGPSILTLDFPELPSPSKPRERAAKLAAHDSYLNAVIEHLPSKSYTVIFTTTTLSANLAESVSNEHTDNVYDSDSWGNWMPIEELHTDLKRQIHDQPRIKRQSQNGTDDRALFEKYSFLGPGMFMGIAAVLILVSILSVGISAIAGLQVSYGSFTKEMAQSAKKQ